MKAIEGYDKLRGGYYTPPDISEFIIRWANLSTGNSILEPSCGDGSFLAAIRKICSPKCSNNVIGIELDLAEADKARKYGTKRHL